MSNARSATKQVIHNIEEQSSDEDIADLYVCTLNEFKAKQDEEWWATLIINDKNVSAKSLRKSTPTQWVQEQIQVLEFMIVDGNVQNLLGKKSCSEGWST